MNIQIHPGNPSPQTASYGVNPVPNGGVPILYPGQAPPPQYIPQPTEQPMALSLGPPGPAQVEVPMGASPGAPMEVVMVAAERPQPESERREKLEQSLELELYGAGNNNLLMPFVVGKTSPIQMTCPNCKKEGQTKTQSYISSFQWI